MRKIDLEFLMGGFYNPVKDQVLLHALSNLKSIPYSPVFSGLSADMISSSAQKLYAACDFPQPVTGDIGTCSIGLRSLATTLIRRAEISESELQNEVAVLMGTVYSDPDYIECLGPFF